MHLALREEAESEAAVTPDITECSLNKTPPPLLLSGASCSDFTVLPNTSTILWDWAGWNCDSTVCHLSHKRLTVQLPGDFEQAHNNLVWTCQVTFCRLHKKDTPPQRSRATSANSEVGKTPATHPCLLLETKKHRWKLSSKDLDRWLLRQTDGRKSLCGWMSGLTCSYHPQ